MEDPQLPGHGLLERIQLQHAKLQSYLHCSGNIQRVHYGDRPRRIEFSKSSDYCFTRPAAGRHYFGITDKRDRAVVRAVHRRQYWRSRNFLGMGFWRRSSRSRAKSQSYIYFRWNIYRCGYGDESRRIEFQQYCDFGCRPAKTAGRHYFGIADKRDRAVVRAVYRSQYRRTRNFLGMGFWRRSSRRSAKSQSYIYFRWNIYRCGYGNGSRRIKFQQYCDFGCSPAKTAGRHYFGIADKRDRAVVRAVYRRQCRRTRNFLGMEFRGRERAAPRRIPVTHMLPLEHIPLRLRRQAPEDRIPAVLRLRPQPRQNRRSSLFRPHRQAGPRRCPCSLQEAMPEDRRLPGHGLLRDGASSATQNPSHTYASAGTYTAVVTATGPGGSNSSSMAISVTSTRKPPLVTISASHKTGTAPLSVKFSSANTGGPATSWAWTFGDGATSAAQNASHTYISAGSFTASLTATGPGGSSTKRIAIKAASPPPSANFTATPGTGASSLTVNFSGASSTGQISSYSWNFGDGTSRSSLENPTHTYQKAGAYTVKLTVTGPGGSSAKAISIKLGAAVKAFNETSDPNGSE